MALPVTFGNLTSAQLSQLDQNFAAVAALGIIPCIATGSNSIALTGAVNTPDISAYGNYLQFSFVAASDATGAVTVQFGALAALNLYLPDGVTQAGQGSIKGNVWYQIAYNGALNTGMGGFIIVSMMPISSALDGLGSTQGDILCRGPSSWVAVPPGSSGQILKTQGSAGLAQWSTVALSLTSGVPLSVNPLTGSTFNGNAANSLGVKPAFLVGYLQCLSGEGGYTVSDQVFFSSPVGVGNFSTPSVFCAANLSSIYVIQGGSGAIQMPNRNTGTPFSLTPNKWAAVVVPYRIG